MTGCSVSPEYLSGDAGLAQAEIKNTSLTQPHFDDKLAF